MALVHIEMSEFKAMEEKAAMLQDALANEKALQEEIKEVERKKNKELAEAIEMANAKTLELKEEAIKAYEESSKKIVKIEKRVVDEVLQLQNTDQNHVLREFLFSLGLSNRQVDQIRELSSRGGVRNPTEYDINPFGFNFDIGRLASALFKKQTIKRPVEKVVTILGLDEAKKEIREQLTKEIFAEYEETVKKQGNAIEENVDLKEEIQDLIKDRDYFKTSFKNVVNKLEAEKKEKSQIIKTADSIDARNEDLTNAIKDLHERNSFRYKELRNSINSAKTFWQKLKFYWTNKNLFKDIQDDKF